MDDPAQRERFASLRAEPDASMKGQGDRGTVFGEALKLSISSEANE